MIEMNSIKSHKEELVSNSPKRFSDFMNKNFASQRLKQQMGDRLKHQRIILKKFDAFKTEYSKK
jgi:hypothetical protein